LATAHLGQAAPNFRRLNYTLISPDFAAGAYDVHRMPLRKMWISGAARVLEKRGSVPTRSSAGQVLEFDCRRKPMRVGTCQPATSDKTWGPCRKARTHTVVIINKGGTTLAWAVTERKAPFSLRIVEPKVAGWVGRLVQNGTENPCGTANRASTSQSNLQLV